MAEVGALRITLGLDTADFTNNLKNVNARLTALNSEFKAITAGAGKFDNSIENLRSRSDVLTRTLQAQQQRVEELRRRYEESKAANGENADQTLRAAAAYNRAVASMRSVEQRLNAVNQQISDQTNPWKNASKAITEYSDKLEKAGEKMKGVGTTLSASVSAPIIGVGLAAGKMANDFDSANGQLEAKLGITADRAAELEKVAETVWKQGFGENVQEAADSVSVVSQNLKGLSDDALGTATQAALVLSKTFGADVADSTKTASSLMKNFGIDSVKAFDIITTGFQKGGDYSGELLDTLNEYSVQFASMGLSADQFLSILISGAQSGAFNLDKVGDAVKEFNIRAQDGSKTTSQGFQAIGLNAQQMGEAIAKGGDEGQKAFVATVSALAAMKDPLQQNIAGTSLFGTQWEDVRKNVITAMSDATKNILTVDGATKKASDAINKSFGSQLQTMLRQTADDFKPIGDDLLKIAKDTLPKVASSVERVTGAFADLSPETRDIVIKVAGLAAAIGPAAIGLGTVASTVGMLGKALAPVITTIGAEGLAGSLSALAGPVGIAVAGIGILAGAGYLLKKSMDESKKANLDQAQSMIDQQKSLQDLTGQYNELRDKNKLSNDELLRYRDLQTELKTAKSDEEVKTLSGAMEILQQKSGLSNSELDKMLGLNDQIVKKTPEVKQSFSDRGNAIIDNKDALDQVNSRLSENIRLELENQKIKAEANLEKNIQNYIAALDQLKAKEQERDSAIAARDATEQRIATLKLLAQQQLNMGKDQEAQKTINEIANNQILLDRQNGKVSSLANEVTQKQNSVNKTQEEITKTQQLYDQMINIQLAQVGINAKGSEGIAQLDSTIQKTQARITELNNAKNAQGGLNAEQQTELTNLQNALGKYQTTKTTIQGIQSDQGTVNQRIDEGTGKARNMNSELSKDAKKKVSIDDGGKTEDLNTKIGKAVTKQVTIEAIWNGLSTGAKAAFHALGVPGFAVGTNFAPGGWSVVGEEGPELMYVPRGAAIKTASETQRLVGNSNASKNASINNKSGNTYNFYPQKAIIDSKDITREIQRIEVLYGR